MRTAAIRAALTTVAACVAVTAAVAGCGGSPGNGRGAGPAGGTGSPSGSGRAATPEATRVVISASAFRFSVGANATGQDKLTAAGKRNKLFVQQQVTTALAAAGLKVALAPVPESTSPCAILLLGQTTGDKAASTAVLQAGLRHLVPKGWRSTFHAADVWWYSKGAWQLQASVGSLHGISTATGNAAGLGDPVAGLLMITVDVQDLC